VALRLEEVTKQEKIMFCSANTSCYGMEAPLIAVNICIKRYWSFQKF